VRQPGAAGIAAALALLLCAGCAAPGAGVGGEAAPPRVEGWVLDEGLHPVENATVSVQGSPVQRHTDASGHYAADAPTGQALLVVVEAHGYFPQSAGAGQDFGVRLVLNFTLVALPSDAPSIDVTDHAGQMSCAVTAVVGQDNPQRPHEHQGVRCYDVVPDSGEDGHLWRYDIPAAATGVIVELFWEPSTPLSTSLVLKIEVEDTGDILGFQEGTSPLHLQLSQFNVLQALEKGHPRLLMTVLPGAGTGSHEHGAVGLFVEQPFTLYASAFFNQAAEPTYSVRGK
jgi:hypothetical protein